MVLRRAAAFASESHVERLRKNKIQTVPAIQATVRRHFARFFSSLRAGISTDTPIWLIHIPSGLAEQARFASEVGRDCVVAHLRATQKRFCVKIGGSIWPVSTINQARRIAWTVRQSARRATLLAPCGTGPSSQQSTARNPKADSNWRREWCVNDSSCVKSQWRIRLPKGDSPLGQWIIQRPPGLRTRATSAVRRHSSGL